MRLLLAIPYFAPAYAFGGSVTVAEAVTAGFVAAGHEVTVATTDVLDERRRLPAGRDRGPAGEEVIRFANLSHRLAARLNGYGPRGLRAWLAANVQQFDVVLLEDFYSAVSVMSARAAERAGVPYALQPLGTLSAAPERGRPLVKRTFMRAWGRRTVAGAAGLLFLAEHEAADLLAAGARRERLVAMPLPLELPEAEPSPASRGERPTVVFVGRLHPIKGIDRLIEAVALARAEVPQIRLEVVGPGEQHGAALERLAASLGVAEHVRFHGYVDAATKLSLMRSAHVSALLSRSEGLPMAALEAMACSVPVVLSRGCHLDEIDGLGGLVVSGEAADAAAALVRLLRDDGLRARLGSGALAFAQRYRRERVMPEMVAALERIAASTASA